MIRARKNSTAVVISPTVTTSTRGRKKVLPDSLPTVTTATRGRKKVLPDSLPTVTTATRGRKKVEPTVTTATRGRKKVLPDSLPTVTTATRGRKKVLPDSLPTVTTSTRGRKKVEPTVTTATRGRKKVEPTVTTATRGRKKVEPVVTVATRGRKKVEPVVTVATRGRKKVEPTVTVATRGRKKVEPAVTVATRGRKKVEPAVTVATRGRKKVISKLPATRKKVRGETGVQQYGGRDFVTTESFNTTKSFIDTYNATTDSPKDSHSQQTETIPGTQPLHIPQELAFNSQTTLSFTEFLNIKNNKYSNKTEKEQSNIKAIEAASDKYTRIKKREQQLEDDTEYTGILKELKEQLEQLEQDTEYTGILKELKEQLEQLEQDTEYTDILKELEQDTENKTIKSAEDIDKDIKKARKKERKEYENNIYNKSIQPKPFPGGRKPRLIVKKALRKKKYRGGTLQEKLKEKLKGLRDKIATTTIFTNLANLTNFSHSDNYSDLISEEQKQPIEKKVKGFADNIKKYGIEKVCKISNKEQRDEELAYYIYVLRNPDRIKKVVDSYRYNLILQNSTHQLLSIFKTTEETKEFTYIDNGYNFFYRPNPEFHIYGMQLPHQFNRVELLSTMYKLHNRGIYSIVDLHDCNGGTNRQHPDLSNGIGCNPYDRDCELDIWAFALEPPGMTRQSKALDAAGAADADSSSSAASKAATAPSGTVDPDQPLTEQFVFSNANKDNLRDDNNGFITLNETSVTSVTSVTPKYYSIQYKDMTPGSLLTWDAISKIEKGLNNKENSIVIHCLAGAGRTGSVMLYLLMRDYYLLYNDSGKENYKVYLTDLLNSKLFGCNSVEDLKILLRQYFIIMDTEEDKENALSVRCMLHELTDTSFDKMKSGTRASLFRQRLNRIIFFLAREFDIKKFKTYISTVPNGNVVTSTTGNIEEEFINENDVVIDDWRNYDIDKLYGECDDNEEAVYEDRFKEVLGWLN
jgi:hypothetical protein